MEVIPVKVLFMGSFDPFTNGHLDILKKAADLFPEVIVGIKQSYTKTKRMFSVDAMRIAIEEVVRDEKLYNVKVCSFSERTIDFAQNYGVGCLVKGLRNVLDYENEEPKAKRHAEEGIKTIYLRPNIGLKQISSTMVRKMLEQGEDISQYVPKKIADMIVIPK